MTLRDACLSGIKLHDLRHFYASGLIARLWPTAEDRTRKAAESIMSAALSQPDATLAESADTGE